MDTKEKMVVLTTLGCKFCRNVKRELRDAGFEYQEFDLSKDLDLLKAVKEISGRVSVPQVYVDGELVGGSSEVHDLLENGKLEQRVKDASKEPLPKELGKLLADKQSGDKDKDSAFLPKGLDLDGYKRLYEAVKALQPSPLSEDNSKTSRKDLQAGLEARGVATDPSSAAEKVDQILSLNLARVASGSDSSASGKDGGELLEWILEQPGNRRTALNMQASWQGRSRKASEVAEDLRQMLLEVYDNHLSEDGKNVDYKALAKDPVFQLFVRATMQLQTVDIDPLTREERIAFFLNTYNILIIHALTLLGPAKNFLERLGWFSSIKYNIGGIDYSADDMEHGILRGNRPTAAALPVLLGHPEWSRGYFKKNDPRMKQVVQDMDKRIHFALNCGAKSCPPIKVFTAETLEEGLQSAAASFCQGEVSVNLDKSSVRLSKLFQWYSMDFGGKEDVMRWLLDYVDEDSASALQKLLDSQSAVDFAYNDYDWSLNAA